MGRARALLTIVALSTSAMAAPSPVIRDAQVPPPAEGAGDEPATAPELARALLFVPRVLTIVVLSPPRLAVWAHDRYQLRDRFDRMFFDDTGTAGLYRDCGTSATL